MKRLEANFVLLVAASTLLGWASAGMAATNSAVSASLSDVQAALNAASPGDTVLVPAGTVTWSNTLVISKQINLIGAGTNATFITSASPNNFLIDVNLTSGSSFRISGINLNLNWTSGGGGIDVMAKVYQPFYNDINGFRIDHCIFANCYYNYGSFAARPIQLSGRTWGCIDHCRFTDNVISISTEGCPWSPSTYPNGPNGDLDLSYMPAPYYRLGSTNTVVVEDCVFSTTANMGSPHVFALMDSRWTATYVFRHNTISDSNGYLSDCLDLHGNQDGHGAICAEIYNNIVNATPSMWRFCHLRGGTDMVYSNTIIGAGSANIEMNEEETYRTDLACSQPSCFPGFGPVDTSYPKHDQVTNSFFWANTLNGNTILPNENSGMFAAAPGWFQIGRDYWTNAPHSTDVLANYRPLVYPDPMVTAQDGGSTGPPPRRQQT